MTLEIALSFLDKISFLAMIISLALGIGLLIYGFTIIENLSYTDASVTKERVKRLKDISVYLVITIVIAMIPSLNDLWKIRIALIKYELASPENIKGATETIERIGKKLECKYLGCEEKK